MVMVIPVMHHHRAKGTGAEAIDPLNGKLTILRGCSGYKTELPEHLVKKKMGTAHMTGSSHADGYDIFTARL